MNFVVLPECLCLHFIMIVILSRVIRSGEAQGPDFPHVRGLNSLAAACIFQCGQFACLSKMGEEKKTVASKILALIFGVISLGIVFVIKYLPGVIQASTGIVSMVGGPVLGVFTLGMLFPFANSTGAIAGTFVSMMLTFWWGFGQMVAVQMKTYDSKRFSPMMNSSIANCPPSYSWDMNSSGTAIECEELHPEFLHLDLYDVSYVWFAPFSTIVCLLVGSCVSLFKPQDHRRLDKRLISPGYTVLFFWCPKRMRNKIYNYYEEVGTGTIDANIKLNYQHATTE